MEKIYKTRAYLFAVVILLLTAVNLSNLKAQYQPFGEEGAEWYLVQIIYDSPNPFNPTYYYNPFKIANAGDTIIQDKLCQMLSIEKLGYPIYPYNLYHYTLNDTTMYIHNDSGRIYYFDYLADRFKLAFDFNAEIGESWLAEFPCEDSAYIAYDIMMFQDTFNYIVHTISYLETEGPSLKRLHVNRGQITERIGSLGYILPYYIDLCQFDDHEGPVFLCSYYDPEVGLINFQDFDCETQIIITSAGEVDETEFVISPNPAFDEIFIQLPENVFGNQSLQVEIYNQLGQRVLHQTLSTPSVEVGHLLAGIYFVHLRSAQYQFKPNRLMLIH